MPGPQNPRLEPAAVHVVSDPARAGSLLQPLRRRILAALTEPDSAAGIARRMRLPRQYVNYHVRALARARLLAPAGRRKRRRFYDQCYVATARAYVLSPELLGKLAADPKIAADRFSAAHLLALSAQMQTELGRALHFSAEAGKRLATLSMNTELRFTSPEQRAEFTRELERAVLDAVARHSAPFKNVDGTAAAGRPFRLLLGCYPIPPEDNASRSAKKTPRERSEG